MYESAREIAMTSQNIQTAFRACGIEPLEIEPILKKLPKSPFTAKEVANPEMGTVLKDDQTTNDDLLEFLRNFLSDTDLLHCESLLQELKADNAILSKANHDLVSASRHRKLKKQQKGLRGASFNERNCHGNAHRGSSERTRKERQGSREC